MIIEDIKSVIKFFKILLYLKELSSKINQPRIITKKLSKSSWDCPYIQLVETIFYIIYEGNSHTTILMKNSLYLDQEKIMSMELFYDMIYNYDYDNFDISSFILSYGRDSLSLIQFSPNTMEILNSINNEFINFSLKYDESVIPITEIIKEYPPHLEN